MSREVKQLKLPTEQPKLSIERLKLSIRVILTSLVVTLLIISIITIGSALTSKDESKPASVSLHGEKTDVVLGENILIKLSAVNLITNPIMHVQVIIIPPSGMSVTSSEFSKSGAGQFTTNYNLSPGDGKDIEIIIKSNQVGNFNVTGRIVYYFGNDTKNVKDEDRDLPIKVRSPPLISKKDSVISDKSKYSGYIGIVFTIIMFVFIICLSYLLIRRMKKK